MYKRQGIRRIKKSNSWYPEFEKRYRSLLVYHGVLIQEDWAEYTYWEFTKWMIRGDHTKTTMDLQSALLYTAAFMDDNDDVHIVTDTAMAAKAIKAEEDAVLYFLKETDDIEREEIEVLVAHDLQ